MENKTCVNSDGFDDIGVLTKDKPYQVLNERTNHDEEIGDFKELLIVDNTGDKRWFESYRFE